MHPAFKELFTAIQSTLAEIKTPEDLAEAEKSLGVLEFWPVVHDTPFASVYDKLRHAKTVAINTNFPKGVRQKGVDDMHTIVANALAQVDAIDAKEKADAEAAAKTIADDAKVAEAAKATEESKA
jgi:hypothetical protein